MPGFSSTIYFPGLPSITEDLDSSPIATILTAALFVLFMGIAPLFWGSISDYYQMRRFLLVISMVIFTGSSLGCALINDIRGLIVLRCIQSVGASAAMAVGGGCLADLYNVENRGGPMSSFFLSMFIGPLIGPIIGGFLSMTSLSWRATFWCTVGLGGLICITTFVFMPETYRDNKKFDVINNSPHTISPTPVTLVSAVSNNDTTINEQDISGTDAIAINSHDHINNSKECRLPNHGQVLNKKKVFNPIRPFLLLRYPHVMLPSLISGIVFGCFFATEAVLPILYEQIYGFVAWQIGLCYLGAGIGSVCGAVLQGYISDRLLLHARAKRDGVKVVEDRIGINLWPCCLVLIPLGLLLFGWSLEYKMSHWIGIVGFGIQTFGMNQLLPEMNAYLLDAMSGQGASVTAASISVRMVIACVLALFASSLLDALGAGYLFVLFAGLSWIAAIMMFINKRYGQAMRHHYGFEQNGET
ncbi:major facilitator superfamily domain-containing protein [Phascolomyces articulosus]|uniref:Major facilitator superfamily domain-containing protein n=1 Tax=Phascolomyces articulosus TaxID=60185 RepID=A0AAD5PJB1_9FUNG|nr:major facilitator superfamily domain-containing protein [Phascolomyces articulosus]